ncbi:IpaD/SipD/SspD family type III secretion system needle tip protein, partial [Morganella morganii subsp. sibonii]
KFNFINDDYFSVSYSYKETLKKTSEIFNDKLTKIYFENAKKGINEEWELDHGKINSYNTIMDGIKKELQMTLDEFSQRYNTINSNYDNMLRVITTMISELTQELKGFLRI